MHIKKEKMKFEFHNPKSWSTHTPMLVRALQMTKGTVVEIGGGVFSTPLLHWLCKMQGRKLITYENDPTTFEFVRQFQSHMHSVRWIDSWDEMDFESKRGVVFVDHHPERRRGFDAIRFKDSAQIVVMHDTEKPEKYNYNQVWEHFKFVHHYKDCRPHTSAASNFIDITNML